MSFKWLVSLAAWLDRRFPPKVVVTQEVFEALQAKEHKHSKEIASLQGEVLVLKADNVAQAKSISGLKDLLSKSASPALSDALRRADFIASGRMGAGAEPVVAENA